MQFFGIRMHVAAAVVLAALGLPWIAGCGSDQPTVHPVNGKVVYPDGTPFPGGVIEFESKSDAAKSPEGLPLNARAAIQQDGTFRLTTFEEGDGAAAGTHRVLVRAIRKEYEPWEGDAPPEVIIDPRFERYDTSGLEVTVEEKENELTITVELPRGATG